MISSEDIKLLLACSLTGVYCGQDPHFAVPLSDGQLLCYSMQGLAYFAFNLISDPTININAYFIPPEKKEDFKEYATFLGDIGIMIQPNNCEGKCKTEDITKITISASDRSVLLDGSRTVLSDRPVHVMVDNTTATIQLGEKLKKGEHPNMIVSVKKPTLSFKVNFVNEHLDLAVMDDNGISDGCHGIMGKFHTPFHSIIQWSIIQVSSFVENQRLRMEF